MRSTPALKALGLCALLTGVMAISASSAQATPEWMEAGVNIVGAAQSSEVKASLENNIGRMLTKINGLSIEITCTAVTLTGIRLTAGGNTTNGKARFTGCQVFKTVPALEAIGECKVSSPTKAAGTIETKNIHGDIVLHEGGKPVSLIKATVPETIAELEFFEEEVFPCPTLPELVQVKGGFEAEDCENRYEEERLTHLLKEEPKLTTLYVISNTPEHKATLDGSANVFLANDANWSGLPG